MKGRRLLAVLVAFALTIPVACSGGDDDGVFDAGTANTTADTTGGSDPGSGGGTDEEPSAEAVERYGLAPERHPDVTYQPDVVIVGGGAGAIRSVSDDGFTWRIDPDASDADKLEVGSVMFLTGRAVGRVLALENDGDALAVTLGPVDITEVIRDGTFEVDQAIGIDNPITVSAGEPFWQELDATEPADSIDGAGSDGSDGAGSDGSGDGAGGTSPPRRIAGYRPVSFSAQPPARQASMAGFSVTPTCCSNGVGAKFRYDHDGVRLQGGVTLTMKRPTAKFHLEIQGATVRRASLDISGAAGLRIDIAGATNNGRNLNKRLILPVDFTVPIGQVLGVPFAVTVNQMVGIQTAFSSKDGNISAHGDWNFNRSIGFGYANGSFGVQAPDTLAVNNSIVDSISGISVGVTGVIVSYQAKFNVGLGALGFTAGLYFAVTATAGLTVGSAAGAPIKLCRSAQVGIWVRYGVGYTIPQFLVEAINVFLNIVNTRPIKKEGGVGEVKNVFNRYVLEPDEPICR